nr:putative ribonuclease H-like domain-containing protein [Tanacetum cinerariifolium]
EGLDSKLIGFQSASKDLDTLLESQRSDKNKEGLGYNTIPPPAQVYSSHKKDMSWTGLPEFADDTITDYNRPSLSIESNSSDLQNSDSSISKKGDSSESIMKPSVKYAEMYRNTTKSPKFDHLAYDCGVWEEQGKIWPKNNNTHKIKTQFRVPRVSTVNRKFPTVNKKFPTGNSKLSTADLGNKGKAGNSQNVIDDKGYWDSGYSRHMTGNISYLSDYEPYDGGYVSFGQGGGKITGKCVIKIGKLEFENVYFVKDLKYNLFSVSQIYDNKNSVLFTDSECIVLGRDFKLRDDSIMLLRTHRQHNMYSIDLNNIVPHKDLTCLVAKASVDESVLWHRRLGHLNFKTLNKLVRHNLVRGLPSKCFENNHTCVAYLKGKQHKASCKTKLVHSMSKPLHTLHMDLFGPSSVSSLNYKWYCLVVTNDFSRFTWTFFLKTKDETSGIFRNFITEIENLKELKVKIIRSDNGGEFRNKEMNDFCSRKRIKREFSNAITPQQNGVAERRNKTLIEAARTMLADAKLPVTFWAKAVNTACYVQNRVL